MSSGDKAEQVVKEIKSHGSKAIAIKADLRDPAFGESVLKAALEGLGTKHVDILGNTPSSIQCS